MADAYDERTGPWRTDLIEWPKSSPVTTAMLRACEAVPNGLIATTIPVGELRQFCNAFLAAYGVPASDTAAPCGDPPLAPAQREMVMLTEREVDDCEYDTYGKSARAIQRAFAQKNAATVKEPKHG